ncbi:Uncharacterised protein [Mycobacteroides abscessus subsp. abscessus]|nr:Uncharacterised protein [Mycobacteroides abscessus subsp. abscessus]
MRYEPCVIGRVRFLLGWVGVLLVLCVCVESQVYWWNRKYIPRIANIFLESQITPSPFLPSAIFPLKNPKIPPKHRRKSRNPIKIHFNLTFRLVFPAKTLTPLIQLDQMQITDKTNYERYPENEIHTLHYSSNNTLPTSFLFITFYT